MAGVKPNTTWPAREGSLFKGAILLESLIAMIIIMLCFGLAMILFTRVTTGSKNTMSILARVRINSESQKTKTEKLFLDEDIPYEEFTIRKRISPYSSSGKIFLMHFTAITPNQEILLETNELVYP